MRLEALDAGRLAERREAFLHGDGIRTDVQRAERGRDERQRVAVLRLLSLRVEIDAHFHLVRDLFTGLGIVDIPMELGARQEQLAGVRAHHLALFADRPLHERRGQARRRRHARLGLFEVGNRVMHNLAALERLGADLDGSNPARLGDA